VTLLNNFRVCVCVFLFFIALSMKRKRHTDCLPCNIQISDGLCECIMPKDGFHIIRTIFDIFNLSDEREDLYDAILKIENMDLSYFHDVTRYFLFFQGVLLHVFWKNFNEISYISASYNDHYLYWSPNHGMKYEMKNDQHTIDFDILTDIPWPSV
jgi:hypothetical protein